MRRILLSLLLAAAGIPALAADAKAIWVDPSCRCFIADVGGEFGFYTWRSGEPPSDGDINSCALPFRTCRRQRAASGHLARRRGAVPGRGRPRQHAEEGADQDRRR